MWDVGEKRDVHVASQTPTLQQLSSPLRMRRLGSPHGFAANIRPRSDLYLFSEHFSQEGPFHPTSKQSGSVQCQVYAFHSGGKTEASVYVCMFQACASLGFRPKITFVTVTKRHHTKLFPGKNCPMDGSGNVAPGQHPSPISLCLSFFSALPFCSSRSCLSAFVCKRVRWQRERRGRERLPSSIECSFSKGGNEG